MTPEYFFGEHHWWHLVSYVFVIFMSFQIAWSLRGYLDLKRKPKEKPERKHRPRIK